MTLPFVVASVIGGYLIGDGVTKTFYVENTEEALATAAVGEQHIAIGCLVVLAACGVALTLGARRVPVALVAALPVGCGVLAATWSESAFPQLAFLVLAPVSGLGVVLVAVLPWRSSSSAPGVSQEPAVR